ncbi:TetR/AcrR family transcriptional regulator [Clostridium sp. YIM B02506]|uniref:TetR/AcrR family transcriptional regulator n=1 Tax=Clostridium sp. YIM B02506 TaxID=2910680 RepID=UPI001EEEF5C3|nr:TetR/AcrR family transcriptional regulator [Clostridium sp. YIM B02506]
MEDRRSIKTKRAIRNAFLELLKEKSINRISVVEISKLADLGRGTFYLHYKDVYELMEHLENELIHNLEILYDTSYPCGNSSNMLKFTGTVTDYMEENRESFLILTRIENGGRILEKIKYFFNQKLISSEVDTITELDKAEVLFIVSGAFGVLEAWLKEGMKMPSKSVSEMLNHVLTKFEC